MNRERMAEELNLRIDALMHAPATAVSADSLLQVAAELRLLPSQEFMASLRCELQQQADAGSQNADPIAAGEAAFCLRSSESVPSFSTRQFTLLPADPRSLFFSFLSHVAVVALITSGIWVGTGSFADKRPPLMEVTHIMLPPDDGGGGGGDRSLTQASRGTPPKFSDSQLAPPVIVVHNEDPKLQAQPTVVGPPDLKLPQSNQIGDLVSTNIVIPSNGTGSRGGIGDNSGTGIGRGNGTGVGSGSDGGYGGGPYIPGKGGVSAPRAIYDPDPEYSDEARRVKFQGNVVLSLVVDPTGHTRDIRVARSLGLGLDEKAIDAVQKWKFTPGMKDGRPVATQVNIEVNFRLY